MTQQPPMQSETVDSEPFQAQSHNALEIYQLLNSSANEIYLLDPNSYRFTFVSEGACLNLGFSISEITEMTPFDLCPVIDKAQLIANLAPLINHDEEQVVFEASHLRKDGSTYPIEVRIQLNENGERPFFVAIALDISLKKEARQQALDQAALLRSVIDATPDLIFFKDTQGAYLGCNKAFEKYANLPEQALLGRRDHELFDPSTFDERQHHNETEILATGSATTQQNWLTHADGTKTLVETLITPSYSADGGVEGIVGISRDVTEHWEYEKKLKAQKEAFEHDAHYDSLTELPNRLLFKDRLGQSLNKAKRTKEGVAVFFIDLDHFKPINDELGHDIGDQVLQEVAKRLTHSVREMDTIARLGGDEFTVIIEAVKKPQNAAIIAHKINKALQQIIKIDRHKLIISASIGISLYPDNGETISDLLKCADTAMYRVKQDSRNAFAFYTQDITSHAFERALMEAQLHNALGNNELCLLYQPQISLNNNGCKNIIGIEALVRWNHPHQGLLLPGQFIPLAEDVGLIQGIDEWVLETACRQMVQWKQQGIDNIRIATNLSSAQLLRDDLYDIVADTLQATGCKPQWLALEIVEGCFINKPAQAEALFRKLSDLGIELVLDDFGTGYTSLSHLRKLPITKLKIDCSFINNVPQSLDDTAIAKAVVGLGKSLGFKVIAEGVETQAQQHFLIAQQCDEAQGYLYSHPLTAQVMGKRLIQ